MPIPDCRTLPRLTLMLATLAVLSGPAGAADPREELLALINRTAAASNDITTARVKCCHIRISPGYLPLPAIPVADEDGSISSSAYPNAESSLTPEEFHTFFEDVLVPLTTSRQMVTEARSQIEAHFRRRGRLNHRDIYFGVSELTIVQDGDDVKSVERDGGHTVAYRRTRDRFYSYFSSQRNVWVEDRFPHGEDSHMVIDRGAGDGAEVLRSRPSSLMPAEFLEQASPYLKVRSLADGGDYQVEVGRAVSLRIDAASGEIVHMRESDPATGSVRQEILQPLPHFRWNGVEMPSLLATVYYDDAGEGGPRLSEAEIYLIIDAEFNRPVRREELRLPVPGGTVLLNRLEGGSNIYRAGEITARRDIEDVATVKFPLRELGRGYEFGE